VTTRITTTITKQQINSSINSCTNPLLKIVPRGANALSGTNIYKQNDLIKIVGQTTLNCLASLANVKQWTIFKLNDVTGLIEEHIQIKNNPSLNYAELVLQPQTLAYGLYRIFYNVTMTYKENGSLFSSIADTFINVIPSGLLISSLKMSQPMFGGTIQIMRGLNQKIEFDPFLFSYDIDYVAVITSLTFKYSCQIIDSNIPSGYPQIPGTNQIVYLDDIKQNSSLNSFNTCFNSTSKIFYFSKY
jgi:hypothetical protein